MSRDGFERLRDAVLTDDSLQERLRASSAHANGAFVAQVVEMGTERGLQIAYGDVEVAIAEARRRWAERWLW